MKKMYLFALLALSLSGCGDYPGHHPNDAVKMSPKPVWGDSVSQEITIGGDCHIDSINDEPGEGPQHHTVKQSGSALKVSGWSAISVKDGVIASDIAIAMKSNSAQVARLFATVIKGKRPDVAEYFKNPASVDTGFKTAIDLTDMSPGEYVLEVIQQRDGKNFKCPLTANIIIEK